MKSDSLPPLPPPPPPYLKVLIRQWVQCNSLGQQASWSSLCYLCSTRVSICLEDENWLLLFIYKSCQHTVDNEESSLARVDCLWESVDWARNKRPLSSWTGVRIKRVGFRECNGLPQAQKKTVRDKRLSVKRGSTVLNEAEYGVKSWADRGDCYPPRRRPRWVTASKITA